MKLEKLSLRKFDKNELGKEMLGMINGGGAERTEVAGRSNNPDKRETTKDDKGQIVHKLYDTYGRLVETTTSSTLLEGWPAV